MSISPSMHNFCVYIFLMSSYVRVCRYSRYMMCVHLSLFVSACLIVAYTCYIQGGQQQRSTGMCLVQCSGQRRFTQPSSLIFEINKFLIGLQWAKERQHQQCRVAGQRVDDDTNRSISSIEEDFLTASEHLGDDSEDDGFRNGEHNYLRLCLLHFSKTIC